jgi:subtilisin family serine protease
MKLSLYLVLVALLIAACSTDQLALEPQAEAAGERYLVVFRQHQVPAGALRALEAHGQVVRTLPQVGVAVVVSADPDFVAKASRVSNVQEVGLVPAFAVPETQITTQITAVQDAPTPADTFYDEGLLWGIGRVRAPQAWEAGITGSHNTVVAVIDTGIATNHPDLAENIVYTDCYTSAGSQAEGACTAYPAYSDHGTHVAGTVAAVFGGGGVVGVGPNLGLAGYNVFEPIPGCGICAFSDSRWAAMIDAAERGFRVINMSLGSMGRRGGQGTQDLNAFIQAENRVARFVQRAGTVMIASAGNSATDLNGQPINLPGGVPGIVNVSATGIRPEPRFPQPGAFDVLAFYSNYGASITLAAPGGDCGLDDTCDPAARPANWVEHLVLSTTVTPNLACAATESCAVGYGWKAGTSMAAPHVAGVAGLVMDQHPHLSPNQVEARLKRTADRVGNPQGFGAGIVDALNATR